MLDKAKAQSFAFPGSQLRRLRGINAAIKGFADAGSDGIIQFSTGGAELGARWPTTAGSRTATESREQFAG
jgi:fructose/tagatose bisphosphate aldolase